MRYFQLLLITLAVTLSANSQAIVIFGAVGCGDWVKARSGGANDVGALALGDWVVGFVDGVAISKNENILKGVDPASMFLWMDNYCKNHPLDNIADGTDALVKELRRKQHKK